LKKDKKAANKARNRRLLVALNAVFTLYFKHLQPISENSTSTPTHFYCDFCSDLHPTGMVWDI
jgi:hypothetical protein